MFRKLAPSLRMPGKASSPVSAEALLKPFPIHHPYRWYGWWKEIGRRLEGPGCIVPSIYDVIDPEYRHPDQRAILHYVRNCRILAMGFSDPPCAVDCPMRFRKDGFALMTDGVWLWPRTLAHDVEQHQVRLPPAMLEHMKANHYLPQLLEEYEGSLEISRLLEWPFQNVFEVLNARRNEAWHDGPEQGCR